MNHGRKMLRTFPQPGHVALDRPGRREQHRNENHIQHRYQVHGLVQTNRLVEARRLVKRETTVLGPARMGLMNLV